MKTKYNIVFLFTLCSFNLSAQNKKWYNNYWVGANIGMLLGMDKQSPNFSFNMGRKMKSLKFGLDYQVAEFSSSTVINIYSLYFDKSINGKKKSTVFLCFTGFSKY